MKTRFLIYSLFVALIGCSSKIKDEKQFSIPFGEVQQLFVNSPSANHQVRIEFTADNRVTCYVVMASEIKGKSGDDLYGIPKNALAKQEKVQSGTIDVTIPLKEEFAICFVPDQKPVSLSVKVNSQ